MAFGSFSLCVDQYHKWNNGAVCFKSFHRHASSRYLRAISIAFYVEYGSTAQSIEREVSCFFVENILELFRTKKLKIELQGVIVEV